MRKDPSIRAMRIITALFLVGVVVGPFLPWGMPVGGKDWWLAIGGAIAGLGKYWYIAIRNERATSPARIEHDVS